MTRMYDDFLECVIYLYNSEIDASNGAYTGGTGFIAGIETNKKWLTVYAITNKHVILGGATAIRVNLKNGSTHIISTTEDDWSLSSTDDLAVLILPIRHQTPFAYKRITADHFLTEQEVAHLNIGAGDNVVIAGRLISADGKEINRPIYRFGRLVANETRTIDNQTSFLVEARSTSGLSGSPVFLGMDPHYLRPNSNISMNRTWFLGVQWGFIRDFEPVFLNGAPSGNLSIQLNTGIMCVVPAWRLWTLLHSADVMAKRNISIAAAESELEAFDDGENQSQPLV